jgi:penicillin-binding protein 1C
MRWSAGFIVVVVFLSIAGWLALPLVPLPEALFALPPPTVELVDRTGRPLRLVRPNEEPFSRAVPLADIPRSLIDATLAAEDKRFFQHPGVDWRASLRALADLVQHGRVVSGGSTITQQLIKLAAPRPRTLRTKLFEAVQALRLEQVWTKERILTEYLNRLDYGNLNVGCAAAAQFYFGKPLADLSVAEAALLAGLPQAPTRLNPQRHLDRAVKRQRWILGRLETNGWLTAADCRRAMAQPLQFASPRRVFEAPHFVEFVLDSARISENGDAALRAPPPEPSRKVRLRTTLDLELNRFVGRTLHARLARLRDQHVRQGAVVVLENRTGDVLALVGSDDFFSPAGGQVNGAWAARSAGSTLKPFTYLLAFERGAHPGSVVADLPVEFPTPTGVFAPVNYNRRCYGPMRYRLALANSLNIAAVKVLVSIGGPAVLRERLHQWGLTSLGRTADEYGLGLTIGNAEVRLLELANAYASLARLGRWMPWRLTAESPVPENAPGPTTGSVAAWWIADILSDNAARTLAFGADSPLRFDFPVACKTGTSSDFRDNWALGYTPEFTVGVWVGNFDGTPMEEVSGVTGAAPVLHDLFEHLHQRHGTTWYARPENLTGRRIHPVTGRLLPAGARGGITEDLPDSIPLPAEAPSDYDAAGRVRLPAEYAPWLASADNWLGDRAVEAGSPEPLRVISPLPGTVFFLDPDLPASGREIPLRVAGEAAVTWSSDTLECCAEGNRVYARMLEGRHRLTARSPRTGERLEVWVEVKRL